QQLRGLELKQPVPRTFMPRSDVRDHYEKGFFEQNPIDEIETTQALLEVLGYVPSGFDLIKVILDVLGEEVLGFYDHDEKAIYIVAGRGRLSPNDEVTLAHETEHAIQDQNYDLSAGYEA